MVWVLTEQSVKSHSISSSVELCHGEARRSTRLVIRPRSSYSHRPITPGIRLHSQRNWCGISEDKVAAGLVSILFRFSPLSVIIIIIIISNNIRNILHEIRKRKANWIGHILRGNCLLRRVIERK